ncbi:uncharacterized protein TNCV_1642601 [Trichonephila clavipes]|nr:uncharacterized protein TNCV_1642601 [Trichonephila clavipes]
MDTSFLPQRFDSPGWALAFSRSLFQASLLPSSVLQFLVFKTRRSFSRQPIHLRFGLPFLRVPIGWALKIFNGADFIHSDNVTCPFNSLYFDEVNEVKYNGYMHIDEAHFWLNGYVNKQNCRIWSEANPRVYVETPLHPEKLTVWCALWAGGILLQKR